MPVSKIRFTVTSSLAVPLINSIEAFRSDPSITTKGSQPVGLDVINADQFQTLDALPIAKLKFEVTGMQSGKWPTMAEMRFYKNENGIEPIYELEKECWAPWLAAALESLKGRAEVFENGQIRE
jgi:hypothetical protein